MPSRKDEPYWPLEKVRATVAGDRNGIRLKKTRALDSFRTPAEAYKVARETIKNLTVEAFCETIVLQFEEKADVYGVRIEERGWMLKLTTDESIPQVVVISLHPLERGALRTKGGMVDP